MYESFYKLHSKPFRLSPDPAFFYPSSGHKRALSYLLYGLNQGEGFVVITGAPGTGKTTLAHKLLSQIDTSNILVAPLSSTQVEADDLLRLVATSFKLRSENVSKAGLIKDIESFLIARARERKRCLLVVDEAQNLPERSIEELRMLSNFQFNHNALLQVFLLGQEQFRAMLDKPELEQLNQRVIANFHLNPLDVIETQRYIEARLRQSGWANDPNIADDAYPIIFSFTGGLPRRINMFCDRLLLYSYMEGLHIISRDTVVDVIDELKVDVAHRSGKVVYTPVERTPPVPVECPPTPERPASGELAQAPGPASASPSFLTPTSPNGPRSIASAPANSIGLAPVAAAPAPEQAAERESAGRRSDAAPNSTVAQEAPRVPMPRQDPVIPDLSKLLRGESWENAAAAPSDTLAATMPVANATMPPPWRTRWTAALGTVVVLLTIGYWFFPYFENPAPPATKAAPDQHLSIAVPEPSPRVQIEDPTERVFTAERVVAPSASVGTTNEPARAADVAAAGALTPAASVRLDSPSPNTSEATSATPDRKLALAELDRMQPSETKSESVEGTRPKKAGMASRPAREPSPPKRETVRPRELESTRPVSIPIAAPPKPLSPESAATALPATSAAVPTSPAAAPVSAPVAAVGTPPTTPPPVTPNTEPLTQLELAQMLLRFSRYYEEGNLGQFIQLFADDVRTEDQTSVEGVRNDYRELFQKTQSRQIMLGDIRWDTVGNGAQGSGPFEVRIRGSVDAVPRSLKGTITFQVEKRDNNVLITGLFHSAQK